MADPLDRAIDAADLLAPEQVRAATRRIVAVAPVVDMHTHLFPPQFGDLCRSGIDDLLTYHYLAAELLRSSPITPDAYQRLPLPERADLVWQTLFVRNTPLSEATRGVVGILAALGLDAAAPDLQEARAFFATRTAADHVSWVLDRAGVESIVMTNDPFDPREARVWAERTRIDPRFRSALRLDVLLNEWPLARNRVRNAGFTVTEDVDDQTVLGARKFLDHWIARIEPLYVAVSLPDDFSFPEQSARSRLLERVVLPACRDHHLPLAMMIGVRRGVNPALLDAGDGLGRADVGVVQRMCRDYPDHRFLVTMLSRENQHELCVAARKFANLMPFGCWWFLNNPSIVSEITRERLELLGPSFIAQHSDARVLEQLLYKWPHARRDVAEALADQYVRLLEAGRSVTEADISRDVHRLFRGNFGAWTMAPDGVEREVEQR